jgi:signal transduction histidine kinase
MLVLGGSLVAVLVMPMAGLVLVEMLAPVIGRWRAVLVVAVGAFFATLILGWLLWRLILAPVRALAARAEDVRAGGPATRLDRYGTPEIGELGQVVLDMARVLQAREMAVRSYADHVSHELKTPLSAIRGAAELLSAEETLSDDARRLVVTISDAEARAERLLAAARQIAAARDPAHHGTTTLAGIAPHLSSTIASLHIEIEGDNVLLPLDGDGLSIVLTHLIENAATAGATSMRISAIPGDDSPALVVGDNGPGISPGNRDRVFDPFFTTRRDEGGTGMGLAIVQTLLLAHGARIALEPTPEGTTFRIQF